MEIKKHYKYDNYYLSNGKIKSYPNTIEHIKITKENELQYYINDVVKTANKKVREIKRIENILKTILRYKGYNTKNLNQRIYNLDKAGDLKIEDKQLLRKIMKRQNSLADNLTELLKFALQLYDVNDEEIKQITKELQEYDKP